MTGRKILLFSAVVGVLLILNTMDGAISWFPCYSQFRYELRHFLQLLVLRLIF